MPDTLVTALLALTGPDRELDARIWCHAEGYEFIELSGVPAVNSLWSLWYRHGGKDWRKTDWPAYTGSLDAAKTLLPHNSYYGLSTHPADKHGPENAQAYVQGDAVVCRYVNGRTDIIALVIAALRAREAGDVHERG